MRRHDQSGGIMGDVNYRFVKHALTTYLTNPVAKIKWNEQRVFQSNRIMYILN